MEIVASLPILEKKLKKMNDNRLSMQNIGHFNGNDLFSEEELLKSNSLHTFEENDEKSQIVAGVSDTHLLVFGR